MNNKYSKIIIDQNPNNSNNTMQRKLSIEEYCDLMHHTHKISDLINDIDDNDVESSNALLVIAELKSIIQTQQNTINELKETIDSLKNQISNTVINVIDLDLETEID